MGKTKLIPGFRFHPTDVELVKYFLKRKVLGKKFSVEVIAEVDIYKYAPWDLPDKSFLRTGDLEWYFFCPRGKKYASGARMNRATEVGYWKTTGRDRSVLHNNHIVGMIKTLVFHTGRPPKGDRTDWVMHEFRLEDKDLTDKNISQDSYVLCRLFQKDGPGPRNGAQYGKPFNEDDWDNDEEIDCVESVPLATVSAQVPILPVANYSSAATNMHFSPSGCIGSSSMSCLSDAIPSPCLMHPSVTSDQAINNDVSQAPVGDDIFSMLDCFTEDNTLAINGDNKIETVNNSGQRKDVEGLPCLVASDIFKDLGDLNDLAGLGEDGHDFSCGQKAGYTTNQMLLPGDVPLWGSRDPDFLELLDLDCPEQQESWGRSDLDRAGLIIEKGDTKTGEHIAASSDD